MTHFSSAASKYQQLFTTYDELSLSMILPAMYLAGHVCHWLRSPSYHAGVHATTLIIHGFILRSLDMTAAFGGLSYQFLFRSPELLQSKLYAAFAAYVFATLAGLGCYMAARWWVCSCCLCFSTLAVFGDFYSIRPCENRMLHLCHESLCLRVHVWESVSR